MSVEIPPSRSLVPIERDPFEEQAKATIRMVIGNNIERELEQNKNGKLPEDKFISLRTRVYADALQRGLPQVQKKLDQPGGITLSVLGGLGRKNYQPSIDGINWSIQPSSEDTFAQADYYHRVQEYQVETSGKTEILIESELLQLAIDHGRDLQLKEPDQLKQICANINAIDSNPATKPLLPYIAPGRSEFPPDFERINQMSSEINRLTRTTQRPAEEVLLEYKLTHPEFKNIVTSGEALLKDFDGIYHLFGTDSSTRRRSINTLAANLVVSSSLNLSINRDLAIKVIQFANRQIKTPQDLFLVVEQTIERITQDPLINSRIYWDLRVSRETGEIFLHNVLKDSLRELSMISSDDAYKVEVLDRTMLVAQEAPVEEETEKTEQELAIGKFVGGFTSRGRIIFARGTLLSLPEEDQKSAINQAFEELIRQSEKKGIVEPEKTLRDRLKALYDNLGIFYSPGKRMYLVKPGRDFSEVAGKGFLEEAEAELTEVRGKVVFGALYDKAWSSMASWYARRYTTPVERKEFARSFNSIFFKLRNGEISQADALDIASTMLSAHFLIERYIVGLLPENPNGLLANLFNSARAQYVEYLSSTSTFYPDKLDQMKDFISQFKVSEVGKRVNSIHADILKDQFGEEFKDQPLQVMSQVLRRSLEAGPTN